MSVAEMQYGYDSLEARAAEALERKFKYHFMPTAQWDPMLCFPPAFMIMLHASPTEVKEILEKEGIYNPFQPMQKHGQRHFSFAIYADENDVGNERAIALIKSLVS